MINRINGPEIANIDTIEHLLPEQWKLDNGIQVWGLNGGSQELVKIDFIFEAGTWYQPFNLVAGLTNAFMNQGSKKYSAQAIAEVFDSKGAYLNLSADQQFGSLTVFTLNKYLDEILEVAADVIKNPVFPQKELNAQISKKRQQFIIENNKVKVLAQKKFSQVVFGEAHPYANTNSFPDYDKLKREHFVDFHQKYYTANNCRIIVAGLYTDEMKNSLNKYFGGTDWLAHNKFNQLNFDFLPSNKLNHFIEKDDSLQSAIRIGRLMPNRNHPDYYGLTILSTVLGGYFGSRLMTNIREDKGYTYGIGSGIFSLKNAAFLSISTGVGVEFCQPALKEIYFEIEKLQNEIIEDDELNLVKNYLLGETIRSFDGVFASSQSLRTLIESDLEYDHYDGFMEALKHISASDLMSLAQIYFNKIDLFEVVAGKAMQ